MKVIVRPVRVDEILQLRHDVLRAGLPLETARFKGDELETTLHFGAYSPLGRQLLMGCVSFYEIPFRSEPAFQLRGMAVRVTVQRRGIGQALLAKAIESLTESLNAHFFWCNARGSAFGFYIKQGWVVTSERFYIKGVGPHYKMTKRV
jgi:predicted GNAT family N-acyltransferase